MLGLGGERGPVVVAVEDARVPMRAPAMQAVQAVRGFAAGLLRSL